MSDIWDKVKKAPDGALQVELEVDASCDEAGINRESERTKFNVEEYCEVSGYSDDSWNQQRWGQWPDDRFVDSVNLQKRYRQAKKDFKEIRNEEEHERKILREKEYLSRQGIQRLPSEFRVNHPIPNVFSGETREWIEDFSNSFGVHRSVAMSLLFGVASIASQGKFKVVRHDNHSELVALYMLISMSSGKMKTPMMDAALAPILKLEKELRANSASEISKNETARKIYTDMIKKEEKKAIKTGNVEAAIEAIESLKQKMPPILFPPKLVLFKFTLEGLESHMYEQGGSMSIAGAELGSFKKIPAAKDDLLLQAWAGEPYSYRKRDEEIPISNPCMSILLATQERTSEKLLGAQALCEDGLVSRFTCLVPPDLRRSYGHIATTEVPKKSKQWLDDFVRDLDGIKRPHEGWYNLTIQQGGVGLREWDAFYAYTQREASHNGTPDVLRSYYRKLAGTALRFAGLLHLFEAVGNESGLNPEISDEHILAGIKVADYYAKHARVALDLSANSALELAHRVVDFISGRAGDELTVREIYRALHVKKDVLEPALFLLQKHNYLSMFKYKKSICCVVNPKPRNMFC
ncbi:DUF3987 domain-containing protein [Maridesulfovibrio sp.]|uniref:DUF3987 domain-containing protein n=1 Tax=Maridesulfovibrio sp. TaxID=2795000 RepID=UPI0029CA249D|nr:DUF3987 domain-containing protein [Maridesulfovibrio sp.]